MSTCYSTLPLELQAQAEAYVEHGTCPDPLLLAVLENNLFSALDAMPSGLSPEAHLALLNTLTVWARVQAPVISRGGAEMAQYWMKLGGRQGRAVARAQALAALAARETVAEAARHGTPHLRVVSDEPAPLVNAQLLAAALCNSNARAVLS